ncbi:MAG: DUF2085 domain-containing protein [Candidatus Gastranaerophilales bacterium]|nr:DUF2085 domain-containing protein [Candidatus Gastranaerophilales bacterium]
MKKIKNLIILIFSIYSLYFVLGSTLAPVMAYFHHYELSAKLTSMYIYSCHQEPTRTFWVLGYPMALCCRCFGFYLGVVVSGVVAIFDRLKLSLKIFLFLLVLTSIDILINYGFGIRTYNTGNITRFIAGIMMGLLFVATLQYLIERMEKKLCTKKS